MLLIVIGFLFMVAVVGFLLFGLERVERFLAARAARKVRS